MVDREDIDALLVGALYGELTPAEEQRLAAHLESHPADRTALDDMTRAREALRESRILTVQLDPPQAVSARLLQEAARRAPKAATATEPASEGWFARFVRSFAARPWVAAAATLVLVLGVAGTIYVRSDRELPMAEQTAAAPPAETASQGAVGAAAAGSGATDPDAERLMRNAGSGYSATLQDDGLSQRAAEGAPAVARDERASKGKNDTAKAAAVDRSHGAVRRDTYLSVETARPQPQPKELEDRDRAERGRYARPPAADPAPAPAPARAVGGGRAPAEEKPTTGADASGAANGAVAPDTVAPVAPPPPPTQTAPRTRDAREQQKQEAEDVTWARGLHERVVAAVAANNCPEAGRLAATLAARAPSYYATNVETDRRLKPCVPYLRAQQQQRR